jgi:hypothetical protein
MNKIKDNSFGNQLSAQNKLVFTLVQEKKQE